MLVNVDKAPGLEIQYCLHCCVSAGPNTFQDTTTFIRDKFVRLNRHPERKTVYTHVTCATDTDNIQFVFDSVVDIIIAEHFRTASLF